MPQLSIRLPEKPLQVTQEQFVAIAAANRDLQMERSADGELFVSPPTGGESGHRNLCIGAQLWNWAEANQALGVTFDSSTGFLLPNGAIRAPDASWVSWSRWDALNQEEKEGFVPLCPDFIVELRSKTDSLKELRTKMQEYMENGARLGWLIDPQNQRVEIYRAGQAVEVLDNPGTLSGEKVLPGFMLTLKRIWA